MLNGETLEERLHEDLDRFQPGFVPVDALISHGKAIKARRRAGFAAGLAAVAALAVSTPMVLGGGGGSSSGSAGGHLTVLASGTIGGKQWSFVTGEPVPSGCAAPYVEGRWGNTSAGTCLGNFPAATDPVLGSGGGDAQGEVSFHIAQLRADVDHVTVTGTDGTVRTPTVVELSGRRYALFALPPKQGITRLDAVGADGKTIAYAMPYNGPEMLGLIESWYPAGTTPTQAAVKQTIFSDTTSSSKPMTVTVDLGPFGMCYLLSVPQSMAGSVGYGPDCFPLTPPAATVLSLRHYPIGGRDLMLTEVNTAVDHVEVSLSDGTTARLTPVRVGGHSFVVTFLASGVKLSGARAYDASGIQLAKTP